MHMISKKDLSNAEMDTLTKSCSPTTVITANGEVQIHEEATVNVTELDIFLTMRVLEDTPAVSSLGKFCDEHGYSSEWINGQKPHLMKKADRGSVLSTSSSSSFPYSTSMTPSRQEIDHPTSSSSSSTSPLLTSSEAACSPFQFALSTRAGTDCVGHVIRALTDANPSLTVTSIDGVGAYDHVYRSAVLSKLLEVPKFRGLLPFARFAYAEPTSYVWEDEDGCRHHIRQGEGREQGDPLMPLLLSLGVHNSLVEGKRSMRPGECLLAYLDDSWTFNADQGGHSVERWQNQSLEQGWDSASKHG